MTFTSAFGGLVLPQLEDLLHRQAGPHAQFLVSGHSAVERVGPRLKMEFHIGVVARQHDADGADIRPAAGGTDVEVVFILAGVDELDDDAPGARAGARERETELPGADLQVGKGIGSPTRPRLFPKRHLTPGIFIAD